MQKVAVVTDSASNLPVELVQRHRIFIVPVLLYLDGRELRDGVDISAGEIYRYMTASANNHLPKTASPSVGEFIRVYLIAAQEAEEIVSIHLSANLSAIYQVANLAKEQINARVHVVDTHTAAMGCGFAVLEAARLAQQGADAEAVIRRAQEVAGKVRVIAMLPRLDYLQKGGHVPAVAALAGSALKICPILTVANDQARVVELPRTPERAVRRLLDMLERDVRGRPAHVAVMHAGVPEQAEELRKGVEKRVPCAELFITEFTPVMGTHTGPGVLGLAYFVEDGTRS
ncbi:MAG: DegV family protein [Anaerolineae bacterium]